MCSPSRDTRWSRCSSLQRTGTRPSRSARRSPRMSGRSNAPRRGSSRVFRRWRSQSVQTPGASGPPIAFACAARVQGEGRAASLRRNAAGRQAAVQPGAHLPRLLRTALHRSPPQNTSEMKLECALPEASHAIAPASASSTIGSSSSTFSVRTSAKRGLRRGQPEVVGSRIHARRSTRRLSGAIASRPWSTRPFSMMSASPGLSRTRVVRLLASTRMRSRSALRAACFAESVSRA